MSKLVGEPGGAAGCAATRQVLMQPVAYAIVGRSEVCEGECQPRRSCASFPTF